MIILQEDLLNNSTQPPKPNVPKPRLSGTRLENVLLNVSQSTSPPKVQKLPMHGSSFKRLFFEHRGWMGTDTRQP